MPSLMPCFSLIQKSVIPEKDQHSKSAGGNEMVRVDCRKCICEKCLEGKGALGLGLFSSLGL